LKMVRRGDLFAQPQSGICKLLILYLAIRVKKDRKAHPGHNLGTRFG